MPNHLGRFLFRWFQPGSYLVSVLSLASKLRKVRFSLVSFSFLLLFFCLALKTILRKSLSKYLLISSSSCFATGWQNPRFFTFFYFIFHFVIFFPLWFSFIIIIMIKNWNLCYRQCKCMPLVNHTWFIHTRMNGSKKNFENGWLDHFIADSETSGLFWFDLYRILCATTILYLS